MHMTKKQLEAHSFMQEKKGLKNMTWKQAEPNYRWELEIGTTPLLPSTKPTCESILRLWSKQNVQG